MKYLKFKNVGFIVITLLVLVGCKEAADTSSKTNELTETTSYSEEELYRPNFHFTPKSGWMNDPNGMFYHNGNYHLYFQHYPDGNTWGPMHWGHAVSKDMITWEEKPIAIFPDEKGYIFSGGGIVDENNVTGFGNKDDQPIIAMYTYHDMEGEKAGQLDYQTQAIAYSLDDGLTFTKYEGNPVIGNPGIKDFRDPKITWDAKHNKWIMALAAGQKIMFYSTHNFKDWILESDFGEGIGGHGGVWECPDIFPMTVEETGEVKWVLLVSINPGGPNGGSATQYFVGDFDGKNFVIDANFKAEIAKLREKSLWIDYGRDNYAGVSWANIPAKDGRRLFMGWMSNWDYANVVPTEKWRSAMTVARELKLHKSQSSYKMTSLPVEELSKYKTKVQSKNNIAVQADTELINSKVVDLASTEIIFNISDLKNNGFTFKLSNTKGDELSFGYDPAKNTYFVDRSKSGDTNFSDKYANTVSTAQRTSLNSNFSGTILLDKTSIELFFDSGETVMTHIFFPDAPFEKLSIASTNQQFSLDEIEINKLKFN